MSLSRRDFLTRLGGVAGAAALAGCAGGGSRTASTLRRAAETCARGRSLEAIEHVVIVMQENRSFDHYFGTYPGVRGFDDHDGSDLGAFAQAWPGGPAETLLPYHLDAATRAAECAGNVDIPIHDWGPQHESWAHGKMSGFVKAHVATDGPAQAPLVMGYLTREDIGFYHSLADHFTICDAYHSSVIGPTMPNRLYMLSATIDPSGEQGGPVVETPDVGPEAAAAVGSVRWKTMPEALSDHDVSWKVYQPPGTSAGPTQDENLALGFNALLYFEQFLTPGSELYRRAFEPSWPDEFTADVRADSLPSVSWMVPPLIQSEHPSSAPEDGEAYVKQVLDILTSNPEVWAKTVLIVTYDENGGFFDHVPPPTPEPGTPGEELTVSPLPAAAAGTPQPIGLGFRVPTMIVSPFSRGGWVNSDLFDHTSILRFIETRWGVPVPNLTKWRRRTVGDLTSTLDVDRPDRRVPTLPAAPFDPEAVAARCPAPSVAAFLASPPTIDVPLPQKMPRQVPGKARRRSC